MVRIGRNCVEYEVPEEVPRGWALRSLSMLSSLKFMKQMQPQGQDIETLCIFTSQNSKGLKKSLVLLCFSF